MQVCNMLPDYNLNHTISRTLLCTGVIYTTVKSIISIISEETIGRAMIKLKRKLFKTENLNAIDEYRHYQIIFFDAKQVDCRKHLVKRMPCETMQCSYYKLQQVLLLIKSANSTVDLCMYLITCTDLATELIKIHNKGIQVRVIVEEEMSTSSESKVQMLIHAGIVVKSKVLSTFMHHKYCLIDGYILQDRKLMTGSLNWTLQGLAGNWENVIVSSNQLIVENFCTEFETMWTYFQIKPKKNIFE